MSNQNNSNTEQLILEVAERLFLEKGFAMTSTVEIAKNVGCNQALVHYYYRTKERLFEAIFEKKIQLFVTPYLMDDNELSFEENLKIKIEKHFDLLRENPKVPFLLFNELLTNPKRLKSAVEKIIKIPRVLQVKLEKDLKKEIEKGTIREMDALDLLLTVVSLNITLFLTAPILKVALNLSEQDFNEFVEKRKQENIRVIMSSLRP